MFHIVRLLNKGDPSPSAVEMSIRGVLSIPIIIPRILLQKPACPDVGNMTYLILITLVRSEVLLKRHLLAR